MASDSMCRAKVGETVDGWVQIGLADPADRRSLWVRLTRGQIELCAGREGDDGYTVITDINPAYRGLLDVLSLAVLIAEGEAIPVPGE